MTSGLKQPLTVHGIVNMFELKVYGSEHVTTVTPV